MTNMLKKTTIIGLALTLVASGGTTYYLTTQDVRNIETATTIEITNLKNGLEAYRIKTETAESIAKYFYGRGKLNSLGNPYITHEEKAQWIQACNEANEEIREYEVVNWGAVRSIDEWLAKCNYVIDKAGGLKALKEEIIT